MMATLDANFSLQAKPAAQRIGVAGWSAKLFGADSAPPAPPAPTVEQLLARPFTPEILRFYLIKRQAELIHLAGSVEGEQWRYKWANAEAQMVAMPKAGDEAGEAAAVDAIARAEASSDASVRLAIAQVASANWSEFLRGASPAPEAAGAPQPQIPPFLQRMLAAPPTIRQTPPAAPESVPKAGERPQPGVDRECEDSQAGERNKADFFLREAGGLLKTRGKEYDRVTGTADDPPQEERSFARVAAAFNAVHDTALTPAQVCHMLALLKQVRLFTAQGFHRDSAADGVAYMALLAEEKSMEA